MNSYVFCTYLEQSPGKFYEAEEEILTWLCKTYVSVQLQIDVSVYFLYFYLSEVREVSNSLLFPTKKENNKCHLPR